MGSTVDIFFAFVDISLLTMLTFLICLCLTVSIKLRITDLLCLLPQVSSHKPNDVTYIELDFTRHSQGRNSLSSANNSRVQLLSSGSQPVNYAVVRSNRHYHTQYTTVNSLV